MRFHASRIIWTDRESDNRARYWHSSELCRHEFRARALSFDAYKEHKRSYCCEHVGSLQSNSHDSSGNDSKVCLLFLFFLFITKIIWWIDLFLIGAIVQKQGSYCKRGLHIDTFANAILFDLCGDQVVCWEADWIASVRVQRYQSLLSMFDAMRRAHQNDHGHGLRESERVQDERVNLR